MPATLCQGQEEIICDAQLRNASLLSLNVIDTRHDSTRDKVRFTVLATEYVGMIAETRCV